MTFHPCCIFSDQQFSDSQLPMSFLTLRAAMKCRLECRKFDTSFRKENVLQSCRASLLGLRFMLLR